MKTILNVMIAMLALMTIAGCATRAENVLSDANPNAYEATRGVDVGESDKDAEGDADGTADANDQPGGSPGF